MASTKRPSSRKSIAYLPSPDADQETGNKENLGTDGPAAAAGSITDSAAIAKQRKTRSKSLGSGGIEALKEDAGNRRKIAAALPKSILKPSIPLSPLREIPTRKPAVQSKPASASASPSRRASSPLKPGRQTSYTTTPSQRVSASPSKATPRERANDKEGPESPKQDDAATQRQKQREQIQKQREARRKSMANRRVSFAPEATLHTFDNLDDMQDSTTSSSSPNSTRRGSQMSRGSPFRASIMDETLLTPSAQAHEAVTQESPTSQRDVHQSKRKRRSSGIPPLNFNNPEDAMSSSPSSNASAMGDEQIFVDAAAETDVVERDGSSSDSASMADSSPMIADLRSPSAGSPSRGLRTGRAREQLAPSTYDDGDEDEGMTMEMAGDEVTAAFQPFVQRALRSDNTPKTDQENINPFASAIQGLDSHLSSVKTVRSVRDDGEMSMDITRAVGGIVRSPDRGGLALGSVQSSPGYRKSIHSRQRSLGDDIALEDGTMDFTAAVGGIQSAADNDADTSQLDQNEDLSMEFTSVFGGIQNKANRQPFVESQIDAERRLTTVMEEQTSNNADDGGDMEMTTALGSIQPSRAASQAQQITESETELDMDVDMDLTRAVGSILPQSRRSQSPESKTKGETTAAQSHLRTGSPRKPRPAHTTSAAASPVLAAGRVRGHPGKNEHASARGTPLRGPSTPQKQLTPQPTRPETPGKTPPANISMRHPSPVRLFRAEIKEARASPAIRSPGLFTQDIRNGSHTPKIRLAPKLQVKRRTSGVGFDKEGLGSPQVAALLDRRISIGDKADAFAPSSYSQRGVHFQDPRAFEAEITKEREEDERRESGQFILQDEADGDDEDRDATTTLRDAIVGMSPKKDKLKGRKSLAVGAAKGLLGKRPAELDEDDEEGTPTQFRGREASPMKRIRLQAPPSASETTRSQLAAGASLKSTTREDRPTTPIDASPLMKSASTPSHQGHFRDIEALPNAREPLPIMGQSDPGRDQVPQVADENGEKITLQDFLNLTSIRFMELNTTKRRHTVLPGLGLTLNGETNLEDQEPAQRFSDAVVAGACTLPMLELYQHSCRELKKYISEGRKIVREIETSTSRENPRLFQEYISASLAERSVMDNQFKNMKTHARHVSKGMWYEWRMKLLEGLREVLVSEAEGLKADGALFEVQERMLENSLPSLIERHEQVAQEALSLQQRADDIADCDQEELASARQLIPAKNQAIRAKQERLAEIRLQAAELDQNLEDGQDAKEEYLQAIKEAQHVREEYRGWSATEVNRLQANVDELRAKHDWSITGASATRLTMVYRDQLELFFDAAAFLTAVTSEAAAQQQNASISLSYIADSREYKPLPLTTEKRFFLQLIRAHLHSIVQREMQVKDLLKFVSAAWTQALAVSEEVTRLDIEGITHCSILSDERLLVKTMLVLINVQTKANISFEVGATANDLEVEMRLKTRAEVAYGEQYREDKMRDFLKARIGEGITNARGSWADAVRQLKERLMARGSKQ